MILAEALLIDKNKPSHNIQQQALTVLPTNKKLNNNDNYNNV